MATRTSSRAKVADQVWLVVAVLHREHPDRGDFSIDEIMTRARREPISRPLRASFYVHVIQHCVANRPPNPGRWRMLVETRPGHRRLFRPGDGYHADREGSRTEPEVSAIPAEYHPLLAWYRQEYARRSGQTRESDALLALRGSGRALCADEPADAYVRRLREGWA